MSKVAGKTKWNHIPTPEEFFGFVPGSDYHMIHWNQLCEYYDVLNEMSDRILVENLGPSSEGNPFLRIYVSAAENLAELEKYRRISVRMADPRGLSETEIDALAEEGRAVCMQSYGLHSNEVGGPQMVPIMLYNLITAEEGELKRILNNVIFIVSPCSEPDGEIVFTDWYNKYLGTEYEGIASPYLRHNWAGHSNNRDAFHETVVESVYLNDALIRGWKPQVFQDHHHQCPFEHRMSIAPYANPVYKHNCPIAMREQAVYGAEMAQALSSAGRKGVVSGDPHFSLHPLVAFNNMSMQYNTVGMLTENADVYIATPAYVHKEQIDDYNCGEICQQCPDPWEGGEWHLSDIVEQMYIASIAVLRYMADHRQSVLKRMAQKALYQTRRGVESSEKAYLLPLAQTDPSVLQRYLHLLKSKDIEFYASAEDLTLNGRTYPAGTVVVPLDQPYYSAVQMIFAKEPYPVNAWNTLPDGTLQLYDTMNLSLALCAGIEAVPAMEKIERSKLAPYVFEEEKLCFPLTANENRSYLEANRMLAEGKALYRSTAGDFYDVAVEDCVPVRSAKIGLLKRSVTGNAEEGFTRNLLRHFMYDYRIVMDKEIREQGVPQDLEVLILPGDKPEELTCGDTAARNLPPEYHTGLGKVGAEALRAFVERGGRLIAWEKTCNYVADVFELPLQDLSEGKSQLEYLTSGSILRAVAMEDALTRGMPKYFTLTHCDGPVLYPTDYRGRVEVIARLCDKRSVYVNGYVKGEELFGDTPCIVRCRHGEGEILLYTFNPEFRVQQDSTFKLLFNALYETVKSE